MDDRMERLAGRVILLWGWRRALAALAAGAFFALAQAPYDFFAAGFVSFPVLVWLLDGAAGDGGGWKRKAAGAFGIGWLFGFGYFVAGLWWTGAALLVEAEDFAWALPFAILGLPALLALFYGFAAALARLVWSDGLGRIAALALGFALAEAARAHLLSGFPWNAAGQAAMPVPALMQSVTLVGMTGMNALAVFVFALPALLASRRHRNAGLALLAALAALHAGFGLWRISSAQPADGRTVAVRIVQPAIAQGEKWDADARERIFRTYLDLSGLPPAAGEARAAVIVWPETAVPFFFSERPRALAEIGQMLEEGQVLLAGAVRVEGGAQGSGARYYNSVLAIDEGGEIFDAADKLRLVPFGEYLPLEGLLLRFGLTQLVQSFPAFSPGSQRRAMAAGGVLFLPFICYEIIFPGIAGHGEAPADILLNVTNDAWFGDTPGPYQHLRQAQIRAVEAGRPLVRAANNGISAVVDAHGRILDAFAIDAVGVLDAQLWVAAPPWRPPGRPDLNGATVLALLGAAALFMRLRRGK